MTTANICMEDLMIKQMKLELSANIKDKSIDVMAILETDKKSKSIEFAINTLMKIESISSDNLNLQYDIEENYKLEFRPPCKKIIVNCDNSTDCIKILYTGIISGWHNSITESFISLNLYSAWFPVVDNFETVEKNVLIKNIPDFMLLKGIMTEQGWKYKCDSFDCNLLAVKNWNRQSSSVNGSVFNVHFDDKVDGKESKSKIMLKMVEDILKSYIELLGNVRIKPCEFDILISSDEASQGGYCRENLVVLSELAEDELYTEHHLAHELAHVWSTGADVFSWEDWLNETFAETMALYHIKEKFGETVYGTYISKLTQEVDELPAIKTIDGSRPSGVHEKGTYLMHKVGEEFGVDKLINLVNIFIKLEEKNTENFLSRVRNSEIADFIEMNLTKVDLK